MNFSKIALITLPLVLFGCPDDGGTGAVTPTGDTGVITPTDDTAVPSTPTPMPTYVDLTIADGDGVGDTAGVVDADTLTVTVTNTNGATFDFGYAQTGVGVANGWFGESCFGAEDCDAIPAGEPSTLTLTRTGSANDARTAPGAMLLPVDSPETATPSFAYVVIDTMDATNCFVGAYLGTIGGALDTDPSDDVSYYSTLNCMDATPVPAGM